MWWAVIIINVKIPTPSPESSLSESALHPNEAELIKTAHFSLHWAKAENSPSFHVASDLLGL